MVVPTWYNTPSTMKSTTKRLPARDITRVVARGRISGGGLGQSAAGSGGLATGAAAVGPGIQSDPISGPGKLGHPGAGGPPGEVRVSQAGAASSTSRSPNSPAG